jgi:hypothetical protein
MFSASRTPHKYDLEIDEEELTFRINQLSTIERAALEESTRKALECHKRCYSIFCKSVSMQPFPITYLPLGLYLVQYCHWFGHTARSIPTIIAHLKRANRDYSSTWLDYESEYKLKDLIRGLRKHDTTPSKQKLPMTHKVMRDVENVADMTDYAEFQHIVMSRVARDALLRGAELVNLRIGEVTWNWNRTQVTLSIFYSKAHKRVDKAEHVVLHDYGSFSGTAYLRQYFEVLGLDRKAAGYPLWPVFNRESGKFLWTNPLPKKTFIDMARVLLGRAGYPALRYAGHSYRSGGATDLWESQRCRPLTIKLHGRWKSDCYRLYIRDNPEKQAEEVAQALAFFEDA